MNLEKFDEILKSLQKEQSTLNVEIDKLRKMEDDLKQTITYSTMYDEIEFGINDLQSIINKFIEEKIYPELQTDLISIEQKLKEKKEQEDREKLVIKEKMIQLKEDFKEVQNKIEALINEYFKQDIKSLNICKLNKKIFEKMRKNEQEAFLLFFTVNNIELLIENDSFIFKWIKKDEKKKYDIRNEIQEFIKNKTGVEKNSYIIINLKSYIAKEYLDPIKRIEQKDEQMENFESFLNSFK